MEWHKYPQETPKQHGYYMVCFRSEVADQDDPDKVRLYGNLDVAEWYPKGEAINYIGPKMRKAKSAVERIKLVAKGEHDFIVSEGAFYEDTFDGHAPYRLHHISHWAELPETPAEYEGRNQNAEEEYLFGFTGGGGSSDAVD